MIIGALRLELRLHGNDSLKGKRQVASSLKQKLRNKFNVAVAETERLDSLDVLVLAVVAAANERGRVDSQLAKALAMVEAISPAEVVSVRTETFGTEVAGEAGPDEDDGLGGFSEEDFMGGEDR
jgi:uncharacterized protein YlxP (DUF503 family)